MKHQSRIPLEVLISSRSSQTPRYNISNYTISTRPKRFKEHETKITAKHKHHDNINSFNTINVNTVISDEDNEIREWLSSLKPHQRHQDVRAERLDGVGDWLLETSEFRKWSKGEDGSSERVLFCSGGPGVGKTYLW